MPQTPREGTLLRNPQTGGIYVIADECYVYLDDSGQNFSVGSLTDAKEHVVGVEHSMALEDQAVGRVDEAVEAETKRQLRRRGVR